MIRKILTRLVLNLYLKKNRDINKLSSEDEFECFLFKSSLATEKILKTYMTNLTLLYFEDKSELERNIDKGGALMLKNLLRLHECAILADKEKSKESKIKRFVIYKNKLLEEITNQKTH